MRDPNSCANFDEITIEHIDLNWNVDFEKTCIAGTCVLNYRVLKETDKIVLDTRDLSIDKIEVNGERCQKFEYGDATSIGRSLTLHGQFKPDEKGTLRFEYATSSSAAALQFVPASLTADQLHPFMYSQCQPALARSLLPCMDTPSVKQTYTACVTVPAGVQCLMSAVLSENEQKNATNTDGKVTYKFVQNVPIPSYLLAIVCGALAKRDISERCAVWAEPSMVDKARWEFEDTERMLKCAEELLGPYRWGRYDMIVLPPFFPYGGMENPCMTFVTPTLICGDRSLVSVVVHEITHSWTGNLVTNSSWEHFWLNEGHTRFIEYKLNGRLYGEQQRQFMHLLGWEDRLTPDVNERFHPNHPFTKMCPQLAGLDPDDAFSTIPYEKGASLLLLIEQKIGSTERFEQFLRKYIEKFAFKSLDTQQWKANLYEHFAEQRDRDVLDTIEWDRWFHAPGMPPQKPTFDETLLTECKQLAEVWLKGSDDQISALEPAKFAQMHSSQRLKFFGLLDAARFNFIRISDGAACSTHLLEDKQKRLTEMANKYSLNTVSNCDILSKWILLAIQARWEPIIPIALQFVASNGRMQYIRPCYQRMIKWKAARSQTLECFERNRANMHPISRQCIENIVKSEMIKEGGGGT